jgi:hypothetical protein
MLTTVMRISDQESRLRYLTSAAAQNEVGRLYFFLLVLLARINILRFQENNFCSSDSDKNMKSEDF